MEIHKRRDKDRYKIADDFTEIIGSGLHYYENVDKLDLSTCKAQDVIDLQNGWIARYRSDPIFHSKVQSIVARLMQSID